MIFTKKNSQKKTNFNSCFPNIKKKTFFLNKDIVKRKQRFQRESINIQTENFYFK